MMILAMMMVMTISANAMSYNAAKNEALFHTVMSSAFGGIAATLTSVSC